IADYCEKFRVQENSNMQSEIARIKNTYAYMQLGDEIKNEFSKQLDAIIITDKADLQGIRDIINDAFSFGAQLKSIEKEITEAGKLKEQGPGSKKIKKYSLSHLPRRIEKKADIDNIINEFNKMKDQLQDDEIIDLNW